jgi:chromosome segregation ATPase
VSDSNVDVQDRTGASEAPALPETQEEMQARLAAMLSDLGTRKAELDEADANLQAAHDDRQAALSKATTEGNERIAAVRREVQEETSRVRQENDALVADFADEANIKRDAYNEALDAATDAKTGMMQANMLSAMGFPRPGRKRS